MTATAQEAGVVETATDSVEAGGELAEVVVEAPKVIRKSDMDVYFPSGGAVEVSRNGMQLLGNLMIPALTVNDALGTVTAAGEAVQIRINGRQSSVDEVRNLLPESIKRVEWIDNPGLRYGGASYVVNFVVANPSVGGSLQVTARPALNAAWGYYSADAKFNAGHSQWEAGVNYKPTKNLKVHRDYSEKFTYPDGASLSRNETSLGGRVNCTFGNEWLSYSYVKPDTTVFMAELWMSHDFNNGEFYHGLLSLSNGNPDIDLTNDHGNKGNTPELSLYWQQNFPRRQVLAVNLSSTFYSGRTYSNYLERADGVTLNDISTDIRDRNQAYAIEADYIKNWDNGRFTAGASYTANRNRSEYRNLGGDVFHQRQDRVYLFAEYYHRFGKWTATAGMGAHYTDYLFRESGRGNHSWSPRPQATVTFAPDSRHNLRLNFTSWQSSPTLAQTNVVAQQVDGFQWTVGNPDLKTSDSYMLTLRYKLNLKHFNTSIGVRGFTSPNAITPIMQWVDDRLITTYENSHGFENVSFFISPELEIIPGWLTISGYLQYRMERMRGTGYRHTNNDLSGNAVVQLMHYGFVLTGQYRRAQHSLFGESITWEESLSLIDLSYNWKTWQFGVGVIMPFGRYDQGSRSLCRWNTNEQHMRLSMRMPYLTVSYNLQWGRQRSGADKLIDVDASADRSSAPSR